MLRLPSAQLNMTRPLDSGFNLSVEKFDGFLDERVVFKRFRWLRCISRSRWNPVFRRKFYRPIASGRFREQRLQLPAIAYARERFNLRPVVRRMPQQEIATVCSDRTNQVAQRPQKAFRWNFG